MLKKLVLVSMVFATYADAAHIALNNQSITNFTTRSTDYIDGVSGGIVTIDLSPSQSIEGCHATKFYFDGEIDKALLSTVMAAKMAAKNVKVGVNPDSSKKFSSLCKIDYIIIP